MHYHNMLIVYIEGKLGSNQILSAILLKMSLMFLKNDKISFDVGGQETILPLYFCVLGKTVHCIVGRLNF